MKRPIYLDYAATTPVDPAVAKVMSECLMMDGVFANPASRSHVYGWQAEEKVELARRELADLIGADAREIVWTSGATEANNLALKGLFEGLGNRGHLITSIIEHKAVIDPAKWLQQQGVDATWLKPSNDGRIEVAQVRDSLREDTRLVSVMMVNNETGVVNPVAEIGDFCRQRGILFHVDASQAVGKMPVNVEAIKADLLSLSGHKFYGPKGVGALYVRRAVQRQIKPIIHGGGHERGLRSGTLATHQLVGIGEAARISAQVLTEESRRISALKAALWQGIADLDGVRRNGSAEAVCAGHLNVCFAGIDGEPLLLSLRELAVSTGSACTSASIEPSYVLKAMGISDEDAHSSIRFSLGRYTTASEVEQAIQHIRQVVLSLQNVQ